MSGSGGIDLIAGILALGWYLVKGAAYLAGGAIYLAAKGAIALGKGIYSAHKAAEERRLAKAREELAAVKGGLGDLARARHEALASAEAELSIAYEKAVEARERRLDESRKALDGEKRKLEEIALELPAFYERRASEVKAEVEAEMESFSTGLAAACSRLEAEGKASVEAARASAEKKLDEISASIAERKASRLSYAQDTLESARTLLNVLEGNYALSSALGCACSLTKLAPTELAMVQQRLSDLEEALKASDGDRAARYAGELESRITTLQVRAEQRLASFQHQKAVLSARAAELRKMVEATHDIASDSPEFVRDKLITEKENAAFWSEGELARLWKRAQELCDTAEAFSLDSPMMDMQAAELAVSLDRLRLQLEQEHAKTRGRLLSRMILLKMVFDVIDSMEEDDWEQVGDAEYQNDDPRLPVTLRFERDGDQMTIVLYDEYDARSGQYKQGVRRRRHDAEVDEAVRAADDQKLSAAMQARGHKDFKMSCDGGTVGQN